MSILSRLFGKGKGKGEAAAAEPEEHKGFFIFPEPYADAGVYRVAARIEKEIGGELKTYSLVRADTCNDIDTAKSLSVMKAVQLIDQMGERLF